MPGTTKSASWPNARRAVAARIPFQSGTTDETITPSTADGVETLPANSARNSAPSSSAVSPFARRDAPIGDQPISLEQTEHRVRIPRVHRQQHRHSSTIATESARVHEHDARLGRNAQRPRGVEDHG